MQSVIFQTFVFKTITQKVLSNMGGKIDFDSFYFSPFSGLNIENLYVEDDRKDTLLFVEKLGIETKSLDLRNLKFQLDKVSLENAFYNLYSINELEQTNMQYIFDYFSSGTEEENLNDSSPFYISSDNIDISNLRFKYKSLHPDSIDYGVNFEDVSISRFDFNAENFEMFNDSMNVDLLKMLIDEKSGFKLQDLKGHAIISSTEISVEKLVLKTPQSHIFANNYSMNYPDWGDMGDFIEKVKLNLDMQLSSVNIADIAFFSSGLEGIDLPTFSKGKIYGKINNLKSKDLSISIGKNTRLLTRFSIQGLPNLEESFLSLDIDNLMIDVDDIEQINLNEHTKLKSVLPELLKRIEKIHYQGNITGFLTDLVAYGRFDNKDGILETDVRFKYNSKSENLFFSGKINTKDLNLSLLNLQDTLFGQISINAEVNAEIDTMNNVKGNIKGFIKSVGINNYNYKNIELEADLDNLKLKSKVNINDTNVVLAINSIIDFSLDEPYFDINGKVKKIYLSRLNWLDRDQSSCISFLGKAQFSSLDLDNFFGEVTLDSLTYKEKSNTVFAERLQMRSTKIDGERNIEINSDLFESHFKGHFLTKYLVDHFFKLQEKYMPSLSNFDIKDQQLANQDIKFDLKLKNTYSLFEIFSPHLLLADHTTIVGEYNSLDESINLKIKSDSCRFDQGIIENINFIAEGDKHELRTDLKLFKLDLLDQIFLNKINIKNKFRSDSLNTYFTWMDGENLMKENAELMSETVFYPWSLDSMSFDISLLPSYLYVEDSIWYVNDAIISIRGSEIKVEDLIINHNDQYLYANGNWREGSSDSLQIILNQINLGYFPIIERNTGLDIQGLVEGNIQLSYKENQPLASGFIKMNSVSVNQQKLGNLSVEANWITESEKLVISAINEVGDQNFQNLKADGFMDFNHSNMNLDISLNKQNIIFFEPFVNEYISNLKGYVSGNLNINGPFDALVYIGDLGFTRAALTYNYLGTRYNFTDKVTITKNRFIFNNLKVFQIDGKGDYASVNGYIQHHNFSDFLFDISIDAHEFMVLNTSYKDNKLYYGTAFITGLTEITGTTEHLRIDVLAETNKNTRFYIPLNDAEEASGNSFISFSNSENINQNKEEYKADLSGIILDFDLKITPDAEVQLIFDNQSGDIVKARGLGNINLNINTLGNFSMSGDYTIDKGDYLFTLQNVINKKFKIEQGGIIRWNGDPYQAYVDIDAIYKLKTPLYDLTLNPDDKERIPVDCHLKMEKSLMSPEINFDIKLPSSGDQAKALINAMDQDEKNKQLLSLLVLNKFYTPDYLRGGEEIGSGNAVGKNASELLSNQLSNWLSQVSDEFDIGVNYRPGDDISSDELEVALSTQLFNDRVAIDGNLGVGKYQNTNSNVVGNVNVDIKINKKGNVRIRGFNRVNENELESNSLYTQGVGLYFREDFDTFGELLTKYWKKATFQTQKDTLR